MGPLPVVKNDNNDVVIVVSVVKKIITTNFKNKILKKEIGSKCQLYKQYEETVDHLTSGCPIL
jgi:hypothetical protein